MVSESVKVDISMHQKLNMTLLKLWSLILRSMVMLRRGGSEVNAISFRHRFVTNEKLAIIYPLLLRAVPGY
jgi:hypothetical protein